MSGFNGSGVWIAPTPVVSGTVILSSVYNANNADIKSSFDNTVTRDGQGAMTGPFKLIDGTVTAPGFSFNAESSTGLYRPSTGVLALTVQGTQAMALTNTGVTINGTSTHTGAATFSSSLGVSGATGLNSLTVAGSAAFAGTVAVPAANGGFEIGSTTVSNTPFIDFHSNGTAHDFDVRLLASGGTTADGQGTLTINAGNLVLGTVTAGGLITSVGPEVLRITHASGYLAGYNAANTVRTGYLQFISGAEVLLNAEGSNTVALRTTGGSLTINSVGSMTVTGASAFNTSVTSPIFTSTNQSNFTGLQASAIGVTTGSLGGIMVQGNGTNAAFMSFHRPASYAAYFGLDTDNFWKVGGWSMGANAYKLYHEGTHAISTTSGVANRVVQADTSGYIFNSYINTTDDTNNLAITGIITKQNGDNFHRTSNATTTLAFLANNTHTATQLNVTSAGVGQARVQPGTAIASGYIEFYRANQTTREGYIGYASTGAALNYVSDTGAGHVFTGPITSTADITAYSDIRVKTDIKLIANALGKVEHLRGITFKRTDTGKHSTGVIAQELQEVLPEAVHENETGMLSVAYGNVVGLLVEAIKDRKSVV